MSVARPSQQGAALLAAMLTVTLVASLAAASLWQQWRSVQVETAERARVQALWVLTGALDWSRLILREDAINGGPDHLGEPWAVPLEEARLSTFLAADKTTALDSDTMTQTFLSGRIMDLQSRLNVRNLVDSGGKQVSLAGLKAFSKLYEKLQLPASELPLVAENLRFALDASPDNGSRLKAPLMPKRISQLGWLGFSSQSLAALLPYITLLEEPTAVNLNTADALVLYAIIPTLDLAQAQRLVTARQTNHFRTVNDAASLVGIAGAEFAADQVAVQSNYFEVHGRLRQDDVVIEQHSVLKREGRNVITKWRDSGPPWVPANTLK